MKVYYFYIIITRFLVSATGNVQEDELTNAPGIQITTNEGIVEGNTFSVTKNFQANIFRGIPYAKPPTGELQFEKPRRPDKWEGVKETKTWPNRCLQSMKYGIVPAHMETDSLDCLYLNVFTPSKTTQDGYPVLFWIHGGGFNMGSMVEYGYLGIARLLLPKEVIVVAPHYRLGIWGFMSTGDEAAHGNFGLWDLTLALQWVHDNIAHFGGDPNKITVFGESAGGAAATALQLSPHSQNLFQQVIAMSGTIAGPWAMLNDQVVATTHKVLKLSGCNGTSHEKLQCFRNKTFEEQMSSINDFYAKNRNIGFVTFVPREDNDFFPEPISVLSNKAAKPMILGTMAMEGAFDAAPPIPEWNAIHDHFNKQFFEAVIDSIFIGNNEKDKILRTLVKHHYIYSREKPEKAKKEEVKKEDEKSQKSKIAKPKPKKLFNHYIEFLQDHQLFATTYHDAVRNSQHAPTWLYSFDHFNPRAFPADHLFKGAQHAMELPYIFQGGFFPQFKFDKADKIVSEHLTSLWTNFAKHGDPTPKPNKGVQWTKFSSDKSNYLVIRQHLEMRNGYQKKAVQFWNRFVPEVLSGLDSTKDEL